MRPVERRADARRAFTLTELLVSIGILAMIGMMLVGVLKAGLDMWDRGETRRDSTERAQIVMGEFLDGLPRVYCEMDERVPDSTPKPLPLTIDRGDATGPGLPGRPGLYCDFDPKGSQRLRFSRPGLVTMPALDRTSKDGDPPKKGATKNGAPPPAEKKSSDGDDPPPVDFARWEDELRTYSEVAYVLEPTPEGDNRLWRLFLEGPATGEDPFPKSVFGSPEALARRGAVVATGVLYLRYRFWSHTTSTWDTAMRPAAEGATGGPELIWDSTRQVLPEFTFFLEKVSRIGPPVDLLPALVQVELTLRTSGRKPSGTTLREAIAPEAKGANVDSTLGFPDAPALLRIDGEWISYKEKTRTHFTFEKRGVRETAAAGHEKDARVLWGETFLITVPVRNYRPPRSVSLPGGIARKKGAK